MRAPRLTLFVSTWLVCLASAGSAWAEADALFREGRKAMQDGDFATACQRFEASQHEEPAPGTLMNLGECSARLERWLPARTYFAQAGEAFPAGDKRRTTATERVMAMEAHLGRIAVHAAPSAPTDLRVQVEHGDDVPLEAPKWAAPGPVNLVVTAAGHQERRYAIVVNSSQPVELTIEAGALTAHVDPSPGPVRSTTTSEQPHSTRGLGYAVGGAGLVAIGVGAVTGLMVLNKASTVKQHCDATYACDPTGVDAASNGKLLSTVSVVGFAVGGAAVALGAYWIIKGKPTPRTATALSVTPMLAPGAGGIFLGKSFE